MHFKINMAYSILYSKAPYTRYRAPLIDDVSPFDHWLKTRNTVIISYNDHYGPDICTHLHFIPDPSTLFGTLYYKYNDDYTNYDICARILIHKETRTLYVLNTIFNYDYRGFGDDEDIHIEGASMRALKKRRGETDDSFTNMTEKFFGPGWHIHRYFKRCHKHNLYKHFLKKARAITQLPDDIHSVIARSLLSQWDHVTPVTQAESDSIQKLCGEHVGGRLGMLYAWSCTIGVYFRE